MRQWRGCKGAALSGQHTFGSGALSGRRVAGGFIGEGRAGGQRAGDARRVALGAVVLVVILLGVTLTLLGVIIGAVMLLVEGTGGFGGLDGFLAGGLGLGGGGGLGGALGLGLGGRGGGLGDGSRRVVGVADPAIVQA